MSKKSNDKTLVAAHMLASGLTSADIAKRLGVPIDQVMSWQQDQKFIKDYALFKWGNEMSEAWQNNQPVPPYPL